MKIPIPEKLTVITCTIFLSLAAISQCTAQRTHYWQIPDTCQIAKRTIPKDAIIYSQSDNECWLIIIPWKIGTAFYSIPRDYRFKVECIPSTEDKLKKASKWYNQRPIDTGSSRFMVGYSCNIIKRSAHGLTVGYASRSGVELGVSTFAAYDRSERLKMAQINLAFFNYNLFNLWKNAYAKVGIGYAGRNDIYCQTGIMQQVKTINASVQLVQSMTGIGLGVSLYRRL